MEAIKFLYHYGPDEEILEKIIFALQNAYNDTFFDEEEGTYLSAPLWYAIVAENHLDIRLVDTIIYLFTETTAGWDFLDAQFHYLVGVLCEALGEEAIERFFNVIEDPIIRKSDQPSLFLFDCIYFLDVEKYEDRILNLLLDKDFYWRESLIIHLGHPRFIVFKPILEKILKEADLMAAIHGSWHSHSLVIETREALKLMSEKNDTKPFARAYSKIRENWESHYEKFQDRFTLKEDSADEAVVDSIFGDSVLDNLFKESESYKTYDPTQATKISRNAPCPCGSGKKYKKCCMP